MESKFKKINLILLILLFTTILGACSKDNPRITTGTGQIHWDKNTCVPFDCKVKEKYNNIKLDLSITSNTEKIYYKVIDEKNKVIWSGTVEKGTSLNEIKTFKATDGTWNAYIYAESVNESSEIPEGTFSFKFLKEK